MTTNTPIISIQQLNKHYPDFSLQDIHLDIPTGVIMGLVGQNGAGKSTLLNAIYGLLPADSGRILFNGKPISEYGKGYHAKVAFVSENQQFYTDFTVAWHLRFASCFYPQWNVKLEKKLLKEFQLDPNKKIKNLSKGMHVKLALLMGLCHHAKLLLLDEPTSGLDPVMRSELLDTLQDLMLDEETSILFSSHISSDIEQISDYVTFIHQGKLILKEEKHTLTDQWRCVKFGADCAHPSITPFLLGKCDHTFGSTAIVKDPAGFKAQFTTVNGKASLVMDPPSIDDILLHMIKGGHHALSHA